MAVDIWMGGNICTVSSTTIQPPAGETWMWKGHIHVSPGGNSGAGGYVQVNSITPWGHGGISPYFQLIKGQMLMGIPFSNAYPLTVTSTIGSGGSYFDCVLSGSKLNQVGDPVMVAGSWTSAVPNATFDIRPPAGKVWLITAMMVSAPSTGGMPAMQVKDSLGNVRAGDEGIFRQTTGPVHFNMRKMVFNDVFLQVKNPSGTSGSASAVKFVGLEFNASDLPMETGTREYRINYTVPGGGLTIRPPVGEVWVLDALDTTWNNWALATVEAGTTRTHRSTLAGEGGMFEILLSNDYYLSVPAGAVLSYLCHRIA